MNFGGLAAKAALKQKPTKQCPRCSLRYPIDEEKCLHCKNVSDSELTAFKEHIEAQKEAGASLGSIFLMVTLILGALLLLSF